MTTRFAVGAAALLLVGQGSDVNELIRQDKKRFEAYRDQRPRPQLDG